MRPLELHLRGFTTFREPTDVDFSNAELFVLSGPTGAGKSSVIDAICFALYGSIPRLSGVAPVISLGMNEARIRLRFEVEGQTYTVSRLVVRHGDGASQRDVRLEGGGAVVEGVRDVDARITALLGLSFDHFTRTVVLPQGRFAAFLEDTPAGRERLLKQLLDLGVYEEMRKRAAGHAARLATELASLETQLHDLVVTETTITEAEARIAALRKLSERVAEHTAALTELDAKLAALTSRRQAIGDELSRLEAVSPPPGIREIGDQLVAARRASDEAKARLGTAEQAAEQATANRAQLGEMTALRTMLETHDRVSDLEQRVADGEEALSQAADQVASAAKAEEEAREVYEETVRRVTDLERTHAAHAIRESLVPGEQCPVCEQPVIEVPASTAPLDLDQARAVREDARRVWDQAQEQKNAAVASYAAVESRLAERRDALKAGLAAVADAPPPDELRTAIEAIVNADQLVSKSRAELDAARRDLRATEEQTEKASRAGASASEALDRARDDVAAMQPPVPDRKDPAHDWEELLAWRDGQVSNRVSELEELDRQMEQRQEERRAVVASLAAAAKEVGITELGDEPKVVVAAAQARAEAELERMRADLDRKTQLESRRVDLSGDQARYDEMARLLRSNNFQQWLIEEALVGLVEFANTELTKLAGGAYSLAVVGGDFEVIDHRNAEARRSVKTLSGGETFLVSLALALALAERVVATSAVGTARLESMFLDEGFGTLDAETLDTVAAVVQELGSRERMVGLVTHVRELADQIPVRFEVVKRPGGSTITRVDA